MNFKTIVIFIKLITLGTETLVTKKRTEDIKVHVYVIHSKSYISTVYLKIAVFDRTNLQNETCVTTISLQSIQLSKTNVKFYISSFKISYPQNFVKIRKSMFFGPKCPNLGIWDQNLKKER